MTRRTLGPLALAALAIFWPGLIGEARSIDEPGGDLEQELARVAQLRGEPQRVSAAGMKRDGTPLLTIENPSPFDVAGKQRRLVIVGGLDRDPRGARLVVDAVRWFKSRAPQRIRREWTLSAALVPGSSGGEQPTPYTFPPSAGFFNDAEQPESRYLWRWVEYQIPDLVLELRAGNPVRLRSSIVRSAGGSEALPSGSLAAAVANRSGESGFVAESVLAVTESSGLAAALERVLSGPSLGPSPRRTMIAARLSRRPLDVARVLAQRYPETPAMNYSPALTWMHTLRLASLVQDPALRQKVLRQVAPWLSGEQPVFTGRVQLTAVAGTMIFAALTGDDANGQAASKAAADGLSHALEQKAPGAPLYGQGWTDDMFMAPVILARAGTTEAHDAAARLLLEYAGRLQRPDGLFNHAAEAPVAWGRGNGFAALGLMEALSQLPGDHPDRAGLLQIYRRQMAAMQAQQLPDGMWREVVDSPGGYREESVTAMTVTAMARGIRLGWIDGSYRPAVQRGWLALLAHLAADGAIVDVCTSTAAGPTLQYYLDRAAVSGADDRGAAFALGAALEIHDLETAGRVPRTR